MPEKHQLQAVIFDVDGTLIDTEKIQSDAFLTVLKRHGHHQVETTRHGTIHTPGEETHVTWQRLKKRYDMPLTPEELTAHKRQAALDALLTELSPLPGVVELFEELRSHNIKLAVASSAQDVRLARILTGLKLTDYLAATVSANDVEHVKPAPDAYLIAAEKLGVLPENCVVVEDAEVGIRSAKAANMKIVAVPNQYTQAMDFSDADLMVNSLEDLHYDQLQNLLG